MNNIPSNRSRMTLSLILLAGLMAGCTSMGMYDKSSRGQTKAYEESEQPASDSWITAKVKADLLVTEETKGLDINVSTTNGVVTLTGKLDNRMQVDKAVAVARAIKGVTSVDATTLTTKPRG
jgi:hyperosmotically inducible periplasmic protein